MTTLRRLAAALALLLVLATAAPAAAAEPAARATPVLGGYWTDFLNHWGGALKKQNGVVMVAIVVGLVSLFIITRGKWQK